MKIVLKDEVVEEVMVVVVMVVKRQEGARQGTRFLAGAEEGRCRCSLNHPTTSAASYGAGCGFAGVLKCGEQSCGRGQRRRNRA